MDKPLRIWQNPNLSKLSLPSPDESYIGQEAVLSGFGSYSIKRDYNQDKNEWEEHDQEDDSKLRYAHTIVEPQQSCMTGINVPSALCARILKPSGGATCYVSYYIMY